MSEAAAGRRYLLELGLPDSAIRAEETGTSTEPSLRAAAEELRRDGLDYLSAPLNLTSTVGGSLNVGHTIQIFIRQRHTRILPKQVCMLHEEIPI